MFNIIKNRSTHSEKIQRWLGKDACEQISKPMKDWYGPKIAIANVPGKVYVGRDGDFVGNIDAGAFASWWDVFDVRMKALYKRQQLQSEVGFSSLNQMIANATAGTGKKREFVFFKNVTVSTQAAGTFFYMDGSPPAGSAAAAAPGGTTCSATTTGSFPFVNPASGEQYLVNGFYASAVFGTTAMLCDRLFSVAKTMSTSASQAVDGVCTRYQSSTSTDDDYSGGNFLAPEVTTTLSATAHNLTVIQYTDQDGNTGISAPSIAGVSSAARYRMDLATNRWFIPLATGDTGIKNLTQIQVSAAALTGGIDFTIYHPLAIFPALSNQGFTPMDFVNSAFAMTRIFDNACLSFINLNNNTGQAAIVSGQFRTLTT